MKMQNIIRSLFSKTCHRYLSLAFLILHSSLFISLISCTDLLDTAPYDEVSTATMWTTENLTDKGIAGIYAQLRDARQIDFQHYFTDICYEQLAYTGQFYVFESLIGGTITPDNRTFSLTWKLWYEGVHRANDAIANIPLKSPVSGAKKAKLIAEAKFLRAFFYYRLNELFRGVPVYLEPVTEAECIRGAETEEYVWGIIINDLTDCINEPNLPDIDLQTGRVTRGAAYALRGKTYMQMRQWEAAAADFEKTGACGYELFRGGYKELFTEANERCREMIFSMQNTSTDGYGGLSQLYCGSFSSYDYGANAILVSPDGVDLYENSNGTPFNWDDVIPGYNAMPPAGREVFFLRDTAGITARYLAEFPVADAAKARILAMQVRQMVDTQLDRFSPEIRALYLPGGNEARIRSAYTGRDPRLQASVITPYSTYLGVYGDDEQLTVSRWPLVSQDVADLWIYPSDVFYYLHRKFVYEGKSIPSYRRCPTDEPIIRYADVLLLWAEALNELNLLPEAAEKVNMVRARPGVDMPPVKYAGQNELREKIHNERRIELINEGITFFDELRWRTWKESKFKPGAGAKQVWGAVVHPYHWLGDQLYKWPVPTTEMQKNPNLKPTEGWKY